MLVQILLYVKILVTVKKKHNLQSNKRKNVGCGFQTLLTDVKKFHKINTKQSSGLSERCVIFTNLSALLNVKEVLFLAFEQSFLFLE